MMAILDKLLHFDVTTVLLFLLISIGTWYYFRNRNLPPGPISLPLVGYLPFLPGQDNDELMKHLVQLGKKHGPVMSVQLGSVRMIMLNTYDAIKEAYVKQGDVFSGRPGGFANKIDEHDKGFIGSDGDTWKEHRRFALSTLKDYGMGKLSIEPKIMEEINCFLNEISKSNGEPIDIRYILSMSTANIISVLGFGQRFEYDDPRYLSLQHKINRAVSLASGFSRNFFPWVNSLPFGRKLTGQSQMDEIKKDLHSFLREILTEHEEQFKENSRKDYIDAYLTERNKITEKTGSAGFFGDKELSDNLLNLFIAGSETTATAVRWAILYMLLHPDIKKKVQREIDDVIGLERAPSTSDKTRMVYTEAVLMEAQRLGSIVHLNVIHSNLEAATLYGYKIPKRSYIGSNLWAIHRDPSLWKDPETFNPDRFISKDGKLQKSDCLIPFGVGRRSCIGEALARMEIFLYFTSILQRFDVSPPSNTVPTSEPEVGIVRRPKPYSIRAVQRKGYNVNV